jgi:large subunit ribosomal protein L24
LVQTTLLTIGIAIILALVAALVGPAMIDWQEHKAEIQEQARQIVGVPVKVDGAIDVRLLPTPSITLGDVQIAPDSSRKVSARGLSMELSLSHLMRGEIRANQVTLDHPDVRIGLDKSGALQMPGVALNYFDPDRLAIERLTITGGRVHLYDAASGAKLTVEELNVSGEVGSLIGPFKVGGTFAAGGEHYAYRLSGSRRGDDGGMKVRLGISAARRAIDFDSDGTVWIDGGAPRFEGAATILPVAGRKDAGGRTLINTTPWKVSGRIKASTTAMQVDKIEAFYGPPERIIRVTGDAGMDFRDPRITGTLAARQLDFDRILPSGEQKRSPFETIKLLVEQLAETPALPLPVRLTVSVDSLMAGGATVSSLHGDVETAAGGWILDKLDMRGPGATQVTVSGKLALADQRKVEFQGPVRVDSNDPAVFFAWIEGHSAAGRPPLGPMRGSGTVTVGSERVAVDGVKAEIERKPLEGRFAYRFATPAAPPRLEAVVSGAEFDFDRALAIGQALFATTAFERPGEAALVLNIGRASYMGVEARRAQASLTYDRSGIKIERLSIGDIAGAAVDASGRLDNAAETWRGSVTLAMAAPSLTGVTALADRFLAQALPPQVSDALHRYGPRITPLKLNARLDLEPQPGAAGGRTAAKLKLDGTIAGAGVNGIAVNMAGTATGDIAAPAEAAMLVSGRLDAPDGRVLASLVGLDALASAEQRPARATFVVDGAANRTLLVNGRFASTSGDLSASAEGPLTASGDGTLEVTFHAANTRLPRRAGAPAAVPADLRARLAIKGREVAATEIAGKVAGSAVNGSLTIGWGEQLRVNGRIEVEQADAGELFAIFAGAPRQAAPEWTAEPFGRPAAPPMDGRVEFKAASALWTAAAPARDVTGIVKFDPSVAGFSLTGVSGRVADGHFTLDGEVRRGGTGISLKSHVKLTNGDLPALLTGVLRVPAAGRLTLDAEFQGQGLSPASLVGSLNGAGNLTVDNFEIAGLNPAAADSVLNALEKDRSLASDAARVTQIAGAALDTGKLKVASISSPIIIADGRAQLSKVQAQNADISGMVSLGLADWQLSARFVMIASPRKNVPPNTERPAMTVLARGPLSAAQRSVEVVSLINWAQQRTIEQETKRLDEIEKERKRLEDQLERTRQEIRPPDRLPETPGGAAQTGAPPSSVLPPPPQGPAAIRSGSSSAPVPGQ